MAGRELSKFEQDTLIEALTQIDAAGKARKLAEHAAAIEQERAGRIAAEAKVGELTAELAKRSEGYQAGLSDLQTKLAQANEGRSTAELLAAQARAEADTERRNSAATQQAVERLSEQIANFTLVEQSDAGAEPQDDAPVSYRINVVGRDAAGDLRSLELVPILKE